MTLIRINDNICWKCGKLKNNMSVHHGIPQHLKPAHNIEIPICRDCHDVINADDLSNMYAYVFKLGKTAEQLRNGAYRLQGEVLKYLEKKEKGDNCGGEQRNEMPEVRE